MEDLSAEESLRAVHIKLDALQLQVAAVGTVRSRCYICNQVQESMMMKAWQLNIITYLYKFIFPNGMPKYGLRISLMSSLLLRDQESHYVSQHTCMPCCRRCFSRPSRRWAGGAALSFAWTKFFNDSSK